VAILSFLHATVEMMYINCYCHLMW